MASVMPDVLFFRGRCRRDNRQSACYEISLLIMKILCDNKDFLDCFFGWKKI